MSSIDLESPDFIFYNQVPPPRGQKSYILFSLHIRIETLGQE